MIKTKVIDESVKELLSTVKSQADKYKSLYKELDELKEAIIFDIDNLGKTSNNVEEKFENLKTDFEVKYENTINSLEEKIEKVSELEIDYEKLSEYREKFEDLLKKFEDESNEFAQSFIEFKVEIQKSVEEQFKSVKSYIDKEIELESRTLESRIYDRIRKVDRHLEQYDKRIYENTKLQEEKNDSMFKQMRSLEGFLESIKSITETMSRNFNKDMRNTESHLLEKIDILEERQEKIKKIEFVDDIIEIDKAISRYKREFEQEVEANNWKYAEYEKAITKLKTENNKIQEELTSNKNKTNIAIVTAVISLLLMIVLVALV